MRDADGFERVKRINDSVEALLIDDPTKKEFLTHAAAVNKLYKAVLPDAAANALAGDQAAVKVIAERIRSLAPSVDISHVMARVEGILDRSIASEGYVIPEDAAQAGAGRVTDLSKIDFEALAEKFKIGRGRTELEQLKGSVSAKVQEMARLNRARLDYLERFRQMIKEYNTGSANIEELFQRLRALVHDLSAEEQRHVSEQLSEEELALFDILTRPEMTLSDADRRQVKAVARRRLQTLKDEKLVLDWRKGQQSQAAVRLTIEDTLDGLPERITTDVFQAKCELVYTHVYDSYFGAGRSVYGEL